MDAPSTTLNFSRQDARADADRTVWLPGDVPLFLRQIPDGRFLMGSRGRYPDEEPLHDVVISQPYWLGRTPVTQRQFAQWTRSEAYSAWREVHGHGESHVNHFSDRPEHPAEQVTWHEASGFCDWLNTDRKAWLPAGVVARLPTEAQWEYACRAGTETDYHTGDGVAALAEAGWYEGNAGEATHTVGEKVANEWGLYDMHGNVAEWCVDYYDAAAYCKRRDGVVDPVVADGSDIGEDQELKTVRSWAAALRSVLSGDVDDGHRAAIQGLRASIEESTDVQKKIWRQYSLALKSWSDDRHLTDDDREALKALIRRFVVMAPQGEGEDHLLRVVRGGAWVRIRLELSLREPLQAQARQPRLVCGFPCLSGSRSRRPRGRSGGGRVARRRSTEGCDVAACG